MRRKSKKYYQNIIIDNQRIPIEINVENRKNIRASLGKQKVILRLPWTLTANEKSKHIRWAEDWFKKQYHENEHVRLKYARKVYRQDQPLSILGKEYKIKFYSTNRKTNGSRILKDGSLEILIGKEMEGKDIFAITPRLISRAVAKEYLPFMETRVKKWNDAYFKKEINAVRLKYNSSNWGSCSSQSNLNFSTRLLLTPLHAIDYVIVHELSHLYEMNHSRKFWAHVARVLPDYQTSELWLKNNGRMIDF